MEANPEFEPLDPDRFLQQSRLQFMVTELQEPLRYEVRFRREADKSTISYVMRTTEPPTLQQAVAELQWLFTVTTHGARTWNRLVAFFTEEEAAMLKRNSESGLDAMVSTG